MGIKVGMAAFAASQGTDGGLFIPVKLNGGEPFPLAQVIFNWDAFPVEPTLRYPFGQVGHLRLSFELQLDIVSIEEYQWVPTRLQMRAICGTLDPSEIVFQGTHEVKDCEEEYA